MPEKKKRPPRMAPVFGAQPPALLRLKFPHRAAARRWLPGHQRLQKVLQEIWAAHGQPAAEVEVNFVEAEVICRLHQKYLGDPSPTDIMTFDLGIAPDRSRLAALCICAEVAEHHARRYRVAPREEVRRLVIHGLLHLLGYDDHTPAGRRKMRRREKQILERVRR